MKRWNREVPAQITVATKPTLRRGKQQAFLLICTITLTILLAACSDNNLSGGTISPGAGKSKTTMTLQEPLVIKVTGSGIGVNPYVPTFAISSDSKYLVYPKRDSLELVELGNGNWLASLPTSGANYADFLSFLGQSSRLLVDGEGGVQVIDVATRQKVLGYSDGGGIFEDSQNASKQVAPLATSSSGAVVLNYRLGLWDARSGKLLGQLNRPGLKKVESAAFSTDNSKVTVVWRTDDKDPKVYITMWEVSNGNKLTEWSLDITNSKVQLSPDGSLFFAKQDKVFSVWQVSSQQKLIEVGNGKGYADSWRGSITPDNRRLIIYDGGPVEVWDILSGKLVTQLDKIPSGSTRSLTISPDGKFLAVGGDPSIHVWPLEGLK